jgi:hypothetical protein
LLQTPIRDSILEFRWIEFILAQTGFLGYGVLNPRDQSSGDQNSGEIHQASFLCFLGTFAGYWPSVSERAHFSFRTDWAGYHKLPLHYAQIHFRCFELADTSGNTPGSGYGLKCQRQRGQIESANLKKITHFEEKRISIFGILSTIHDRERMSMSSIYRVLILADTGLDFPGRPDLKESKLEWHRGFGGVFAFQEAIFLTVRVWETEWNKALDQIDKCLSVQLNQTLDSDQVTKWMFDFDFKQSRLYFTILQILRIFGECIRTLSADIKALDGLFNVRQGLMPSTPKERLAFSSNWKHITKHQKDAEERLLRRLSDKTEEIESLRDGVYCYELPFSPTC